MKRAWPRGAARLMPEILRVNRDFRLAYFGGLISWLGSAMSAIAYPLLVLSLGGTALQAGAVVTVSLTTRLALRLPAGQLADRWSRRTVMVCADLARAVALGSIPLVALLGQPHYAQLIAVAVVEGAATALFGPALDILTKDIVSPEHLAEAAGLNQAILSAAYLAGPAIGGALFGVGREVPFAVDAATFAVCAAFMWRIAARPPVRAKGAQPTGGMLAGIRWLAGVRELVTALAYASVVNLVSAALEVLAILDLRAHGASAGQIGLILSCIGIGSIAGAVAAPALARRLSPATILSGVGTLWSCVLTEFAFGFSPPVAAVLLAVLMTFSPAAGVVVSQMLLRRTPRELLGRVSAATSLLLSGLAAVGPLLAGALGGSVGISRGWLVLAALTAAATALSWLPLRASRVPSPVPVPLAAAIDLETREAEEMEEIDVFAHQAATEAALLAPYPAARRMDLIEDVHGHQVRDPYRWLEDAGSAERDEWLRSQAELYAVHQQELPGRDYFASRVRELLGVGSVGTPVWRGDRCFFTRRLPGQEHAVLCTSVAGGEPVALVDPMALDPSGLTTLDAWQADKEGRLVAYQLSSGGDEQSLLRVLNVSSGEQVDGPIDRCRHSSVAWLPGGKAFYYIRRLPPSEVPAGESQYHRRVYLHQVGTSPDDDVLVFGSGRDKTTYYSVSVSWDGRWLTISASLGTAPRNDVWLADLSVSGPASPDLRAVAQGLDAYTSVRVGRDGRLYVYTDEGASRGRLAITRPEDPGPRTWRDLISEDPSAVLRDFAILDGTAERPVLLALWSRHSISEITVHDLETGALTGTVPLPGLGSVARLAERPEGGSEVWFGYTDYTTPPVVLRFDVPSSTVRTWARAPGGRPAAHVVTQQVTYDSADGTPVRMLVISDGEAGRPRPAILYGYGGFGVSLTPAYSATILAWVRAGGVYAIASLRGGGEEGESWHRAGMLDQKQNVFDDFYAAASALISGGWTTSGQLAIWGGSNGGLLVGAALVQRPALFSCVLCSAPLLDMVRYERFGLGETWSTEYGSASDPEQLEWLLAYSPYHHVAAGVEFPAVLFTVFGNDSRVDPLHAFKMCAALQHATASGRPVLLRAEEQVGHGSRAVSRQATLSGDMLAFAAEHTGLAC